MLIKYTLAWLGMMIIAIANGGLRDILYKQYLGDLAAHQLSTVLLLLLLALYFRILAARWPLASYTQAWAVGLIWLVMTLAFEFGFGHFIVGHSWAHLFQDYDILAGRVWVLIPIWILTGPVLFLHIR